MSKVTGAQGKVPDADFSDYVDDNGDDDYKAQDIKSSTQENKTTTSNT